MTLAYMDLVNPSIRSAFTDKVALIAKQLVVDPNWLMQVMKAESGLNHQAVNFQKGDPTDKYQRAAIRATGLIQFMPKTAVGLGTTNQKLFNMTAIQQLDYVYKYFKPMAGKMKSYYDVYAYTFFPAAIGKPDTWVLSGRDVSANKVAQQNPALDSNKDKVITVAEFKAYVKRTVPNSLWATMFGGVKDAAVVVAKKVEEVVKQVEPGSKKKCSNCNCDCRCPLCVH